MGIVVKLRPQPLSPAMREQRKRSFPNGAKLLFFPTVKRGLPALPSPEPKLSTSGSLLSYCMPEDYSYTFDSDRMQAGPDRDGY